MNKLMMVVAMLVMAIAMTGCGTIEAKRGGKRVITDGNLTSLTFSDGRVTQTGTVPTSPGSADASSSTNITATAGSPQS